MENTTRASLKRIVARVMKQLDLLWDLLDGHEVEPTRSLIALFAHVSRLRTRLANGTWHDPERLRALGHFATSNSLRVDIYKVVEECIGSSLEASETE